MRFMKSGKSGDQPFHGDGRLAGKHKDVFPALSLQSINHIFQLIEQGRCHVKKEVACLVEKYCPVAPIK